MTIPPIFTWLWLATIPPGIQLDLEFSECRQMLAQAIAEKDATKLENVLVVCRAIERKADQ